IVDLVLERDHSLIAGPIARTDSAAGGSALRTDARAGSAMRTGSSATHSPAPASFSPSSSSALDREAREANRLAELAVAQTQSLQEEVSALEETPDILQEEVSKIAERQSELQKIVAGATTRWLAAKEKLEEYRGEIQAEIREVIVRCHN